MYQYIQVHWYRSICFNLGLNLLSILNVLKLRCTYSNTDDFYCHYIVHWMYTKSQILTNGKWHLLRCMYGSANNKIKKPWQDAASVHWCFIHVCFIQVTMCCTLDALTCLGTRNFLLISHLLRTYNQYKYKSARTEAREHVGSSKQCSKLSLGQNNHG